MMVQVLEYIMGDKLWYTPGTMRYSDLSMIVLGLVVERITAMPLEVFTAKEIYEPVSDAYTSFLWSKNRQFLHLLYLLWRIIWLDTQ